MATGLLTPERASERRSNMAAGGQQKPREVLRAFLNLRAEESAEIPDFSLEYLVVTVPNPISIYARDFAQHLAGVRKGLEHQDYIFDRYHFPCRPPT